MGIFLWYLFNRHHTIFVRIRNLSILAKSECGMCLILFSFDESSDTPLILAANRDEFFKRPSANAHYWEDAPDVFAGRDLVANGTWLGVTRSGRFAAVTNVREPDVIVENALSRGDLTRLFLTGDMSPENFLSELDETKMRYSGFNLLVGEFSQQRRELFYVSNRKDGIQRLNTGVYGLSNHLLDSAWPKVEAGKHFLQTQINETNASNLHQTLRAYLENPSLAEDDVLPKTGVSYEKEKALSAAFIELSDYGTRTSTVLTIKGGEKIGEITFSEKQYIGEQANDKEQLYTIPLS